MLDQNLSLFRNTIEAEFNFNRVNKDTTERLLLNQENFYPSEELLADFNLIDTNGHNALQDVVLSINAIKTDDTSVSNDIDTFNEIKRIGEVHVKSNLEINLEINADTIRLDVVYNDAVFENSFIEQFMMHYMIL